MSQYIDPGHAVVLFAARPFTPGLLWLPKVTWLFQFQNGDNLTCTAPLLIRSLASPVAHPDFAGD